MRKFFAPLILSLFFFIPFKVNGATRTYNFVESDFDFVENNLDTAITTIENSGINAPYSISNKKDPNNSSNMLYILYYNYPTGYPYAYYDGATRSIKIYPSSPTQIFNSSFTSLTSSGNVSWYYAYMFLDTQSLFLQYSSSPIYFNQDSDTTFVFTYGEHTYSVDALTTNSVPTMKDLYDMWFSEPPPPPDNTPLLTTFYSVVIDKIGEICTFFTSNYLYLSVFVIFLFYISILLLRRFIK